MDRAPPVAATTASLKGRQANANWTMLRRRQTSMLRVTGMGHREHYIAKALEDYKSRHERGRGVAVMPEVAYPLTERGISALAHYLSRF